MTARALMRLNRDFYRDRAELFRAARRAPWPGWERLLEWLPAPAGLDVLDVGCGHGRFLAFLDERVGPVRYLGIDESQPLLDRARERPLRAARASFACADFLEAPLGERLPPGPFGLIVLFGVLHHVPGAERRRALLAALAERLSQGGLLVFTSWQFASFERFRARILPWEDYNRDASEPIATDALEPGDYLLPWGDSEAQRAPRGQRETQRASRGQRGIRYCHFADEREIESLLAGLPLKRVESYAADGRGGDLNRYTVLRAAP